LNFILVQNLQSDQVKDAGRVLADHVNPSSTEYALDVDPGAIVRNVLFPKHTILHAAAEGNTPLKVQSMLARGLKYAADVDDVLTVTNVPLPNAQPVHAAPAGSAVALFVAPPVASGVVVAVTVLLAATNTANSSPKANPVHAMLASFTLPEVVHENPFTPDMTVRAETVGA
jgi:hypothetical protein